METMAIFVESFHQNIEEKLNRNSNRNLGIFVSICNNILDKLTPRKKTYLREDQSPFTKKTMNINTCYDLHFKLRHIFLHNRTDHKKKQLLRTKETIVFLY